MFKLRPVLLSFLTFVAVTSNLKTIAPHFCLRDIVEKASVSREGIVFFNKGEGGQSQNCGFFQNSRPFSLNFPQMSTPLHCIFFIFYLENGIKSGPFCNFYHFYDGGEVG